MANPLTSLSQSSFYAVIGYYMAHPLGASQAAGMSMAVITDRVFSSLFQSNTTQKNNESGPHRFDVLLSEVLGVTSVIALMVQFNPLDASLSTATRILSPFAACGLFKTVQIGVQYLAPSRIVSRIANHPITAPLTKIALSALTIKIADNYLYPVGKTFTLAFMFGTLGGVAVYDVARYLFTSSLLQQQNIGIPYNAV